MEKSHLIAGALMFVILVTVASAVISDSLSAANNSYTCLAPYTRQSADLLICTNESDGCYNPLQPIFNTTYQLCTNASGVGVVNSSRISGFSETNVSATFTGPSAVETGLLGLIVLFLVLAGLYATIEYTGLLRSK